MAMVSDSPPPTADSLIPGLPDEIAEQCLLRLSFPYQALARSVSAAWKAAISSPAFLREKKAISLPEHLFVFAFDRSSLRLQWQALEPFSRRWFVLPPMPLPAAVDSVPLCSSPFATVAVANAGEIYVLGGMRSDTRAPLGNVAAYRAATNSWFTGASMSTPRAFFTAGAIGGRIFTVGGSGGGRGISAVDRYDPAADRWSRAAAMRWSPAAAMRSGMARCDAAVVGRRMYVTEGWTWPFSFTPRGGVFDADGDAWEKMGEGMVEGWTGSSAVVGERIFVVSEFGERKVKAYDARSDTWRTMGGGGVPEELKRPYAVAGGEGRIYVAASGMDVGVGTVVGEDEGWRVEWEVVKGPPAFAGLTPSSAHVLHA